MSYRDRIAIEPGKRGGRPCVRTLRIAVHDVLGWLASGMSEADILRDHPDLEREDIRACIEFVAIEEGLRDLAAGNVVGHAAVVADFKRRQRRRR